MSNLRAQLPGNNEVQLYERDWFSCLLLKPTTKDILKCECRQQITDGYIKLYPTMDSLLSLSPVTEIKQEETVAITKGQMNSKWKRKFHTVKYTPTPSKTSTITFLKKKCLSTVPWMYYQFSIQWISLWSDMLSCFFFFKVNVSIFSTVAILLVISVFLEPMMYDDLGSYPQI